MLAQLGLASPTLRLARSGSSDTHRRVATHTNAVAQHRRPGKTTPDSGTAAVGEPVTTSPDHKASPPQQQQQLPTTTQHVASDILDASDLIIRLKRLLASTQPESWMGHGQTGEEEARQLTNAITRCRSVEQLGELVERNARHMNTIHLSAVASQLSTLTTTSANTNSSSSSSSSSMNTTNTSSNPAPPYQRRRARRLEQQHQAARTAAASATATTRRPAAAGSGSSALPRLLRRLEQLLQEKLETEESKPHEDRQPAFMQPVLPPGVPSPSHALAGTLSDYQPSSTQLSPRSPAPHATTTPFVPHTPTPPHTAPASAPSPPSPRTTHHTTPSSSPHTPTPPPHTAPAASAPPSPSSPFATLGPRQLATCVHGLAKSGHRPQPDWVGEVLQASQALLERHLQGCFVGAGSSNTSSNDASDSGSSSIGSDGSGPPSSRNSTGSPSTLSSSSRAVLQQLSHRNSWLGSSNSSSSSSSNAHPAVGSRKSRFTSQELAMLAWGLARMHQQEQEDRREARRQWLRRVGVRHGYNSQQQLQQQQWRQQLAQLRQQQQQQEQAETGVRQGQQGRQQQQQQLALLHDQQQLHSQQDGGRPWSLPHLRAQQPVLHRGGVEADQTDHASTHGLLLPSQEWGDALCGVALAVAAPHALPGSALRSGGMASKCSTQDVALITWSLAVLRVSPPPAFMVEWLKVCHSHAPSMSGCDLGQVVWALAKLRAAPSESLMRALADRAAALAAEERLKPQDTANLLWGCAKLGFDPGSQTVDSLFSSLPSRPGVLKPMDVANMLWACGALKRRPASGCMQLLLSVVCDGPFPLGQQELSNVLWALARLNFVPSSQTQRALTRQLHRLLSVSVMGPSALAQLTWALPRLNWELPGPLQERLAAATVAAAPRMNTQGLLLALEWVHRAGVALPPQQLDTLLSRVLSKLHHSLARTSTEAGSHSPRKSASSSRGVRSIRASISNSTNFDSSSSSSSNSTPTGISSSIGSSNTTTSSSFDSSSCSSNSSTSTPASPSPSSHSHTQPRNSSSHTPPSPPSPSPQPSPALPNFVAAPQPCDSSHTPPSPSPSSHAQPQTTSISTSQTSVALQKPRLPRPSPSPPTPPPTSGALAQSHTHSSTPPTTSGAHTQPHMHSPTSARHTALGTTNSWPRQPGRSSRNITGREVIGCDPRAHVLSQLLWVSVKVGRPLPHEQLQDLLQASVEVVPALQPREACCVVWSLARMQHMPPLRWVRTLLSHLARLQQAGLLSTRQQVLLFWGLRQLRVWSHPLLQEFKQDAGIAFLLSTLYQSATTAQQQQQRRRQGGGARPPVLPLAAY